MNYREVDVIEYRHGDEPEIEQLLYASDRPLVLRMPELPDTFDLDYFAGVHPGDSTFYLYDQGRIAEFGGDKCSTIIERIKNDEPVRIFGEAFPGATDEALKTHIPLWTSIPFRPRYYSPESGRTVFFFGAKGANTKIHYDREFNCNLHVSLSGRKRILLFTVDDSENIYKLPFISDSAVDFSMPLDLLETMYPKLKDATCYQIILNAGDMLYMPKWCWHYVEYIEPNVSATFAFYPKKSDQFWGFLNGLFYLGFAEQTLGLNHTRVYRLFTRLYLTSGGLTHRFCRMVEMVMYAMLYPLCVISFRIKAKLKGGRFY